MGILDTLKQAVISSLQSAGGSHAGQPELMDERIALGVLLWIVAEADSKVLDPEIDAIEAILQRSEAVPAQDLPLVMAAVRQAAKDRVDLYQFTKEVSHIPYNSRMAMIDNLFRVAYADRELDSREQEVIRDIAGLFGIAHQDLIASKLRIREEAGS